MSTLKDRTFLQGPRNCVGPRRYVPFGTSSVPGPMDEQAAFHADMNACIKEKMEVTLLRLKIFQNFFESANSPV